MPQFSSEFWIMLLTYGVSFGAMYGQTMTRLKYLEAKMDKHNNVTERMVVVERDLKSAWRSIDEIKEEQKHERCDA